MIERKSRPAMQCGVVISKKGLQIKAVASDNSIRLLYKTDKGTMIEWFYSREDISAGVIYSVTHGTLNQSSLWDAYDKCSMDVMVLRVKGGEVL